MGMGRDVNESDNCVLQSTILLILVAYKTRKVTESITYVYRILAKN
jgi:hypothetical protein